MKRILIFLIPILIFAQGITLDQRIENLEKQKQIIIDEIDSLDKQGRVILNQKDNLQIRVYQIDGAIAAFTALSMEALNDSLSIDTLEQIEE